MTPLEQLAGLAPTLKEAELRVLLYLSARAAAEGGIVVAASSREIGSSIGSDRSAVKRALHSLCARKLIATREGTSTKPAVHQLNFLETVSIGGVLKHPPGGVLKTPPPGLFDSHPGVLITPPSAENKQFTAEGGRVDLDGLLTCEGILDRMRSAKPRDFDEETSAKCRRFLHSYIAKLGTRDALANGAPHPPDAQLVAQFLSLGHGVGGWPRLEALLYDLMNERKEVSSYGWFVTVAMQRIHGISATVQRMHREKLKLMRGGVDRRLDHQGAKESSDEDASFEGAIRSLAQAKRMR